VWFARAVCFPRCCVQNGVGLQRVSYSSGVLIDITAPTCTMIDGGRGQSDVDGDTTGVARLYLSCTDMESGVPDVLWGLGTAPGLDDVVPLAPATPSIVAVPLPLDVASTVPASHKSPLRMIDVELVATGTVLDDGVQYYGMAVATNGAGGSVLVTTDGQQHDTSPPSVPFIHDTVTATGEVDVQFAPTTTSWGAMFSVVDPESGVSSISAQLVADAAGGEVVLQSVSLAPTVNRVHQVSIPALTEGVRVFTRLTVSNGVGQTTVVDSDGWIPETSAPTFIGTPVDGSSPGADVHVQTSQGTLAACWEATDAETQVDHFMITATAGTTGPATALVDWIMVPRSASVSWGLHNGAAFVEGATCGSISGIQMNLGDSFRVMVQAVNPLGQSTTAMTNGVIVDWSPPVVGAVVAGPDAASGVHAPVQANTGSLTIGWNAIVEGETPLISVEVAIGSRPLGSDVSSRTPIGNPDTHGRVGSTVTVSGLSLVDGQSYFVSVFATNGAGLEGTRFSRLVVDGSAPVFSEVPSLDFLPVYTLPTGFGTQASFPTSVSGATVTVPLSAFVDPHSGIATLDVVLYTSLTDPAIAAGVTSGDLLPGTYAMGSVLSTTMTVAGNTGLLSTTLSGLTVGDGAFVWAVVTATNGVGFTTGAASRATQVSTALLTPGTIVDGSDLSNDLEYQPSTASYSVRWSPFVDPDGQEVTYRVAVGTAPGLADLIAWQSVGSATELDVLQEFSVPPNTAVYATVEGSAGFRSITASSNGAVLGAVAPTVSAVQFENHSPLAIASVDPLTGAQYLSSGPIVVSWTAADPQGLTTCTVVVQDAPRASSTPLLSTTVPHVDGLAQFDVTMPEGQALYATVTCSNIRGRDTTAEAVQWGIVETTPPSPGVVLPDAVVRGWDGSLFSGSTTDASVSWSGFEDAESHLVEVAVCLGTASSPCSDVDASVAVGTASFTATGLSLVEGQEYIWSVVVTSGAGVSSTATAEAFTVDTLGPDATAASVSLDIGTGFAVSWQGFSDSGSGVASFAVMLGTSGGLADIAGPVSVAPTRRRRLASTVFDEGVMALIAPGQSVVATVEVTDVTGNVVEISSDSVLVDSSAPSTPAGPVMETVNLTSAVDIDVQAGTSIAVEWPAFTDAESGMMSFGVLAQFISTEK